tara:strand:+ start:40 stop:225 length:186 start_codon:yes stop_codon:yes gene_type:complete
MSKKRKKSIPMKDREVYPNSLANIGIGLQLSTLCRLIEKSPSFPIIPRKLLFGVKPIKPNS